MSAGTTVGQAASLSPMTIGLRVADVQRALDFYRRIGFVEDMVVPHGDGRPAFCHMRHGTSSLVFDAIETGLPLPETRRERDTRTGPWGLGVKIGLDVPDIEPIYRVFVEAGCDITAAPTKTFWCARLFNAIDPFGYQWEFRQPSEDRPLAELVAAARQEWKLT